MNPQAPQICLFSIATQHSFTSQCYYFKSYEVRNEACKFIRNFHWREKNIGSYSRLGGLIYTGPWKLANFFCIFFSDLATLRKETQILKSASRLFQTHFFIRNLFTSIDCIELLIHFWKFCEALVNIVIIYSCFIFIF